MKKLVAENLNEYWVSSDTGAELYADYPSTKNKNKQISNDDLSDMLPPSNMKLTPEEFDNYITQLIDFIPQSPGLTIKLFKTLLTTHSYLTKKSIGFKSNNPYENSINKFITAFKMLTER
jgi:hypothetical protein